MPRKRGRHRLSELPAWVEFVRIRELDQRGCLDGTTQVALLQAKPKPFAYLSGCILHYPLRQPVLLAMISRHNACDKRSAVQHTSVPMLSSSPHNPQAEYGGSPSLKGKSSKAGAVFWFDFVGMLS